MTDEPSEKPNDSPLKPARPDPEELEGRPDYMPRLPWKWALVAVLGIAGVYYGYQHRETARADAMRAQILATHEERLAPLIERYRAFREQIEDWTMEAASAGEPERWVDPRLRIAGLHGGDGLYLRLRASDATSREGIERGARAMREDAITRCLGIAPASARGLYESGSFLMPSWLESVRSESDFMRLRVVDEQLARHLAVDVPVVANLLSAQYFLLIIQQGENRRDAPVDVYLWDLREHAQLLRARIQARGVLVPVRIDRLLPGVDVQPAPGVPTTTSAGAHDCSIAAQIKALTGDAPVEVGADALTTLLEDGGTSSASQDDSQPSERESSP